MGYSPSLVANLGILDFTLQSMALNYSTATTGKKQVTSGGSKTVLITFAVWYCVFLPISVPARTHPASLYIQIMCHIGVGSW